MALSAFEDKDTMPQAGQLKEVLGRSYAHWDRLIACVAAAYPAVAPVWSFSGAKYAEGRGFRIEVRTAKDRKAAETLAAIKMGR